MQKGEYIEIIARAVIINRGKILLCKQKKENYFFLPGGHVEFGESIQSALAREIKEELAVATKRIKFLAFSENTFRLKKGMAHEINFIYRVTLKNNHVHAVENHLEFHWVELKKFPKQKFLPLNIRKELLVLIRKSK